MKGKDDYPCTPDSKQRGECLFMYIRKMQSSFSWDWVCIFIFLFLFLIKISLDFFKEL